MTENWTKIVTSWKGGMGFIAENSSGGKVQIGTVDGQPGVGPMQMLLAGLAGCTGVDIVTILEKKKVDLVDFKIEVEAKKAETYPMIWTDIHVMYLLWSESIQSKDVELAIKLSEEKYCSVSIMLAKSARIESDYRILKPGESADDRRSN